MSTTPQSAVPLWPLLTLPIVDRDEVFPVRRVYCVAKNYAAHAREMGADPDKEAPFFFTKHVDNLVPLGGDIAYPSATENLHHEVELVAVLKSGGANIKREDAYQHVFGFAVGLDMTRRDLQKEASGNRRPWDMGKNFEQCGPIGPVTAVDDPARFETGLIQMTVNGGEPRQTGDLSQMIWTLKDIIAFLSGFVTLKAGDIIFTGTPSGVGPVVPGDVMACHIDGLTDLTCTMTAPTA